MATQINKAVVIKKISRSSRAFLLLKPDAIRRKQIGKAISSLSSRLEDKGIKHMIIAPVLANMSNLLAETLLKEHAGKEWFEQSQKPFMMGVHPDNRIPSTPVVAFILEMKKSAGQDLFNILRGSDVIGPTDPFKAIKEHPEKAEEIKKCVRYTLISEYNDAIMPFDDPNCPVMNRIHCSANETEAEEEIATFYLSIFEYVSPYYNREAAKDLKALPCNTGITYTRTPDDFRLSLISDESTYCVASSLSRDKSLNDKMDFLKKSSAINAFYRDFKVNDAAEMVSQIDKLMPKMIQLRNKFFF
jgi:nucleoside diphosphate kinase